MRSNLFPAIAVSLVWGGFVLSHATWGQDSAALVLPVASGPLETLRKFNIGDSQFESFFNGEPLGPAEEETLAKILYRWPRLGQDNVESWRQEKTTWDQLAAAPVEHRGEIFHLRGRVTSVRKAPLAPEIAQRLEFEDYYSATVQLHNSPYIAQVCASYVPAAWARDKEIDEPVSADGLFLKVGDAAAERPTLIFAAERIAWHPDKPHPEHHIGKDQVALAQRGLDWGLFESVLAENGQSIGGPDREPFYQTLAVVAGEKGSSLPPAYVAADVPTLLQRSKTLLGSRMKVQGIARRITKVTVSAADIHRRFGIKDYYEIDFSLPLDKPMKVAKDAKSKDSLLYANNFPATLIVRRLPEGLQEGENLHQVIAAEGTFYKLWSYQSAYTSQKNMRQAAPLFMAPEVRLIQEGSPLTSFANSVITTAMLLAGGTFFLIYWWFRVSDRKSRSGPAATIHDALRQGTAQATAEKPDFSGLK